MPRNMESGEFFGIIIRETDNKKGPITSFCPHDRSFAVKEMIKKDLIP
ncbi:hypothetical protein KR50_34430 [Jeotgalibacillus campisalis]|uniref:Uncharacterized protein n=1 Tax=Jeotgalibacillus campisalis TaxID=220754 RepID=A0A0C2QYE8_9BACL|nr:hypothetical protein KR50_34430 [Jeotgalibacillus campisalis]